MSIGRRLLNLARSELNSLLDKAADATGDEDLHDDSWGDLHGISDSELAAELERRRQARDEAEHAATGTMPPPRPGAAPRPSAGARPGPRPQTPRRTSAGDEAIRRAYAALEVAPGSDFDTVRKAYRRLMRKYHPDLHTSTPAAQRAANDLAQKLTESYKLLEKQLRK